MKGCADRSHAIMMVGGCSCPTDPDCSTTCAQRTCKDSCDSYGECLGYNWWANTGVNAGGSEPPECNADIWCVSGIWLS